MAEYDPLIEILKIAEESCGHLSKAVSIRNLRTVLREDPALSKELQKRIAAKMQGTEESSRHLN